MELTACGLCGNPWKTGANSGHWSLGRLYNKTHAGTTALKVCQRESRSPPVRLVKSALTRSDGSPLEWNRPNSSVSNGSIHIRGGFGGGGDVSCVDPGRSSFISSRRPSTVVEAGRSKAKKGSAGGKIERRPASTRLPKTSNLGQSQDRTTIGREGVNQGEQQPGRDAVDEPIKGGAGGGRWDEKELNSTWQELGLRERRSGGKFLSDRGAPVKEATRMGGWGRDKSMQRVITPEEQRASRGGRRERIRSGVRQKVQTSGDPAMKKKKKKFADFNPDPKVRHPPEYYKNGPYGPHAWKGIPVGKIVEGNWSTNQVVYFSNVKDEAEREDRAMANVAVNYTKAVATFDRQVGIQYFYAFARRTFGPRPDPWEDWTLVAQIAIESGRDLDHQGDIFRKIGSISQDITTQCVAWARPDLTYVKKPKLQLRLEPQEKFLKELLMLLDPTKDGNSCNSFYATLCGLVKVGIEASPMRVRNAYDALDEHDKMVCLKHVFTNHPIQVLSSARYERQLMEQRGEPLIEDALADFPFEEETDDESYDPADDEEVDHQAHPGSDSNRNLGGSMEFGGMEQSDGDSIEQQGRPDDDASKRRGFSQWDNKKPGMRRKRLYYKPVVRSAVRPYSYSNIIEEIAEIRTYLSRKAVHDQTSLI